MTTLKLMKFISVTKTMWFSHLYAIPTPSIKHSKVKYPTLRKNPLRTCIMIGVKTRNASASLICE